MSLMKRRLPWEVLVSCVAGVVLGSWLRQGDAGVGRLGVSGI
jgi:hypothetical protein